jgi:acyl-CoA reductase-like NAD-dependent aldehyde dehydrogenase
MTITSADPTSPLVIDDAQLIGGPFGGYQHSGFGRTMGADAVLDYTQVKTVSMLGTESAAPRG